MAYTDIDKPSDYFNTVLYTGTSADNRAVTGVGFQPDFLWIKDRTSAFSHALFDSVRGSSKMLVTQGTEAEQTDAGSGGLTSFDTDGFTTDAGSGGNPYRNTNQSGDAYASWNWKAGTSFTNDASATGIGTIDSTGSASDTAGFSIVSYTGTGSAGTIKHGLSATANFMIIKNRDAARSWNVYFGDQTKYMYLNDTAAQADAGTIIWNNTAPTSSVFSIGTDNGVNQSGEKYIAYVFSQKQGYSKFGSYTGNGSANGPFNYLGFKPAWLVIKRTDSTGNWHMFDNKRNPHNVVGQNLYANITQVEGTDNTCDFLSNGFKLTASSNSRNGSGNSYIYMAFAENPFVTSTGVPATAR